MSLLYNLLGGQGVGEIILDIEIFPIWENYVEVVTNVYFMLGPCPPKVAPPPETNDY